MFISDRSKLEIRKKRIASITINEELFYKLYSQIREMNKY
jgi:hypothetical protein